MATAPFGIEMGSGASSITVLEEIGGGKYYVTPPKPHPLFSSYLVQASPTFGVVWVKGLGLDIDNDAYGTNVRTALDRIGGQLATRYGPGAKNEASN